MGRLGRPANLAPIRSLGQVCEPVRRPAASCAARKVIAAGQALFDRPGTICGDLGMEVQFNLVNGSDSRKSVKREIKPWFPNA